MKARLQTSLGQQLVLTPQLRQAIHLLQLSALELDAELTAAVESNPLLEWVETEPAAAATDEPESGSDPDAGNQEPQSWNNDSEPWQQRNGSFDGDDDEGDAADRVAEPESLRDHLLWHVESGAFKTVEMVPANTLD